MPVRRADPLIAVDDIDRCCDFHALLGFSPSAKGDRYARLVSGDAVLHVAAAGDAPPDRPTIAMSAPDSRLGQGTASALIVLESDDCAQTADRLTAAGVDQISQPASPPWGGEIRAFVADPDGHLVELNQPTQ